MSDKCPKCGLANSHGETCYNERACRIRELEATVAERDATIAGLRAMLQRWVTEPTELPGWDDPDCTIDDLFSLSDACEVHGVEAPEWLEDRMNAINWVDGKDGAE